MSHTHSEPVARRGFLFRLSQATAALTALLVDPTRLQAASSAAAVPASADPDAWMARLKGQQKVMLMRVDSPEFKALVQKVRSLKK